MRLARRLGPPEGGRDSASDGDRTGRAADDQLGLEEQLVERDLCAGDLAREQLDDHAAHRSIGWRTVVSGGSVQFIRAESSKPTTETSSGTRSPARLAARIAPRAIGSLAHTMPVMPRASRRVAAACAASSE